MSTLSNNDTYFWGEPDISVKFCEKKYDTVFWVAEFYNTVSALTYIFVGLFYYSCKLKNIAIITTFMGISTMIMHGTLRYYGQILDEVSLLILLYENVKRCYKINTYNYLYPILAIYLKYHNQYFVFITLFFILKFGIIYHITFKKIYKNQSEKIFLLGYVFYMIIAFICWLKDQFLCDNESRIQYHALWHYFSGFAIFFGFLTYI
tara:strand:+ start:361 stop:978 length:618 start_codon:yes stop_codon:yes gene_type:complete